MRNPVTGRNVVTISTHIPADPAIRALEAAAREYRRLADAHEEAAQRLRALDTTSDPEVTP